MLVGTQHLMNGFDDEFYKRLGYPAARQGCTHKSRRPLSGEPRGKASTSAAAHHRSNPQILQHRLQFLGGRRSVNICDSNKIEGYWDRLNRCSLKVVLYDLISDLYHQGLAVLTDWWS